MYNKIVSIILLAAGVQALDAQSITLEEAKRTALTNRLEIQEQTAHVQLAGRAKDKLKAQWLPQINLQGDVRWNTQLQTSVIPVGEFGIPGLPADAVQEVKFGLPFNNLFGLSADQKIFDATRRVQEELNATQLSQAENEKYTAEQNIKQTVTTTHAGAVYLREKMHLAEAKLARAGEKLQLVNTQLQQGTALPTAVQRVEIENQVARRGVEIARLEYERSRQNLADEIGLAQPLEPAETFKELLEAHKSAVVGGGTKPANLVRQEQILRQQNSLNVQLEKKLALPTVNAYANYSLLQLADGPNPVTKNSWFPYNFIGIKAQWTVFDGHYRRQVSEDYQLKQQINDLKIQRFQQEQSKAVRQAQQQLQLAELNLDEAQQRVALERLLLEEDQLRFSQGTLLLTQLDEAENAVLTAEENYLRSMYDYLSALIQLRQAKENWD